MLLLLQLVTGVRWQVTRYKHHATCDTWHMTHDFSFLIFPFCLLLSVLVSMFLLSTSRDSVQDSFYWLYEVVFGIFFSESFSGSFLQQLSGLIIATGISYLNLFLSNICVCRAATAKYWLVLLLYFTMNKTLAFLEYTKKHLESMSYLTEPVRPGLFYNYIFEWKGNNIFFSIELYQTPKSHTISNKFMKTSICAD